MIITLKPVVTARLIAPNGEIEREERTKNFLTEAGEAYLADRLSDRDEVDGDISHWAIGSGSGRDRTATTLVSELARNALESGYPDQGTSGDDNDVLWRVIYAAGTGTGTITESALFSAVTSGTMINYIEFSPGLVKSATQTLQLDLTWTIGAS